MNKDYHRKYMFNKKKALIRSGKCVDCWTRSINKRRSSRRCTRCLLSQKKMQQRYRLGLKLKG